MALVPDKLFVNMYGTGVGRCAGTAYYTKADADRAATEQRELCVELGARVATSVVLSEDSFTKLTAIAAHHERSLGQVIDSALAIHYAIPNEVRVLLHRYAAEHKINFATAVAEACRAYMTDAAR